MSSIQISKDGIGGSNRIIIDNSVNIHTISNDSNTINIRAQGLKLPYKSSIPTYEYINGNFYYNNANNEFEIVEKSTKYTISNVTSVDYYPDFMSDYLMNLTNSDKNIRIVAHNVNSAEIDISGLRLLKTSDGFLQTPEYDGIMTDWTHMNDGNVILYNTNNTPQGRISYDSTTGILLESSNNLFDLRVGKDSGIGMISMKQNENEFLYINKNGVGFKTSNPANDLTINGNVNLNYSHPIKQNRFLYSSGGVGLGEVCGSNDVLNVNNKCNFSKQGDVSANDISTNILDVDTITCNTLSMGNNSISNKIVFKPKTGQLYKLDNGADKLSYLRIMGSSNNFNFYSPNAIRFLSEHGWSNYINFTKNTLNLNDSDGGHTGYSLYSPNRAIHIIDCSLGTNLRTDPSNNNSRISELICNGFEISNNIIQSTNTNLCIDHDTTGDTNQILFNENLEISGNVSIGGSLLVTKNNINMYKQLNVIGEANPMIKLTKHSDDTTDNIQLNKNGTTKVKINRHGIGIKTNPSSTVAFNVSGDVYGLYPVGSIIMFNPIYTTLPSGWKLCNGDPLNSSTYTQLYNAIGSTYGGNSTTFKLPNLVKRIPCGFPSQQPSNSSGGSNNITNEHMPGHSHSLDANNASISHQLTAANMRSETNFQTFNTRDVNGTAFQNTQSQYVDSPKPHSQAPGLGANIGEHIVSTNNGLKALHNNISGEDGNQGDQSLAAKDGETNNSIDARSYFHRDGRHTKQFENTDYTPNPNAATQSVAHGLYQGSTNLDITVNSLGTYTQDTNAENEFIPKYATVKFIIYTGVH